MLNKKSSFSAQITPRGARADTMRPTKSRANMLAKIVLSFIVRSLLHSLHPVLCLYRICHRRRNRFPYKKVLGGTVEVEVLD